MKNIFRKCSQIILVLVLITSCKKEVIYPTDQLPQVQPSGLDTSLCVSNWGKFLVIDAVMYLDDKQTGEHFVYNHFVDGKDTSSLRWGGSMFDIETIIKDVTTYSFWKPVPMPGTGKFELNSDSTKFYQVNYIGQNSSIIEDPTHSQYNLGGSARPFAGYTIDKGNNIVGISIQEMEGVNQDGHPIHYWTELKLRKIESW